MRKKSALSQYTSWLSKSRQNLFSLDGYLDYEYRSFELLAAQAAVQDRIYRIGPARLTHVRRRELYGEHWRGIHGALDYYHQRLRSDPIAELDQHDYERADFEAGLGLLRLGDHSDLARRLFERAIVKAKSSNRDGTAGS